MEEKNNEQVISQATKRNSNNSLRTDIQAIVAETEADGFTVSLLLQW